ncbi:MAG: hypothetical protein M1827_000255 [Pycnora praestabilis]|nr:MAG: hypothetical protein M1827_000255 [Pycnora praestabilis]
MATKTTQPPWTAPQRPGTNIPKLEIYNSLTRTKTMFIPQDPKGRSVSWYACGPTVYDDAHLGHARNYVSTDIIRRIMRDYFKYDLHFVMNITDVDDKVNQESKHISCKILTRLQIIKRGRQQHLLAEFIQKHSEHVLNTEAISTTETAYQTYARKNLGTDAGEPRLPENLQPEDFKSQAEKAYASILEGGTITGQGAPGDKEAKIKMHLNTMSSASDALQRARKDLGSISSEEFYTSTQDVLLPYLDSLYGSSINADDHSIFTKLTQKYEGRFMEDVRALNCLDPDEITRVTEYGPQIVSFVERIVQNGFAYVTPKGVYFDINAFEAAGNSYARLEPWNRNDKDLQADGEGSLTTKDTQKRSDADFALWKTSRPGEPSWPSPWGRGRPGWHIECSAMASDKLGKQIDIHSGGIDLAFPHHDNELAQSEAYWLEVQEDQAHANSHNHSHQWVNYFLHMGHLSIQGSKMSKSLKNFTTIREALERGDWTPRGLRIVFLLGGWKEGVEITDDLVKAGSAWEDKINNFFIKVKDIEAEPTAKSKIAGKQTTEESQLLEALQDLKDEVDRKLCDSFNTPGVMAALSDLVSEYNKAKTSEISPKAILQVASWVTLMVNTLGLNGDGTSKLGWSGIDIPDIAKPYIYPLSRLRDEARQLATKKTMRAQDLHELSQSLEIYNNGVPAPNGNLENKSAPYSTILASFRHSLESLDDSPTLSKDVLRACDNVRDTSLWDLGIYLEDQDTGGLPAIVRPLDKELVAARADKVERERQKQVAKEEREKEAMKRAEKGKLSHLEMFRTAEFSVWDEEGLPVKDAEGNDVVKSRSKKLRKDWERQKKLHETWMASR